MKVGQKYIAHGIWSLEGREAANYNTVLNLGYIAVSKLERGTMKHACLPKLLYSVIKTKIFMEIFVMN